VGIRIPGELGNGSPIEIQDSQIVHCASLIVHAGAKDLDLLGVIELPIKIPGYGAGKPLQIRIT